MLRKPYVALGLIGVVFVAVLVAQDHSLQLSPGEVHISSRPYQPETATIHSQARLVQVEIVVRDSRGKPVKGLTKDDFEVLDSGKKREMVAFSIEAITTTDTETGKKTGTESPGSVSVPAISGPPQPASEGRSIALFFDDVNTPVGDLARAKIAASRFVKEELSPGDRVAIFDTSAGEVVRFTSDVNLLISAVRELQSHPRASAGGIGSCPRITPYQAYRISNGDPSALQAAVLEDCQCPGHDPTQCFGIDGMPAYQLSSSMEGGGGVGAGGYLGGANDIVAEVKTQASATWLQTKLISDSTFSAIRACLQSVSTMPGKSMLLIASSGFISGESDPQEDLIVQEALRAAVVINAIDAKGLYAETPGRPLDEPSEATKLSPLSMFYEASSLGERLESQDAAVARFTESTGGLFFRNNNDLNLGFYRLGVIPEVAYLVGFAPADDGNYHKLKVELKNKGSNFVQARPGYFAPNGAVESQSGQSAALDRAMADPEQSHAVPAAMTLQLAKTAANGRRLSLNIHVDARSLPFQHQKDVHVERLIFVAALYDLQGTFITGKEAEMDLALKP
ncbi:MAG: VWA domain-containing protein, partial [Candidatus Sulfotelmatobacter sp.]